MRKMHVSIIGINQHKSPRMTNHSACGRFGRVYSNTRHKTCLTDSIWYMVMRNGLNRLLSIQKTWRKWRSPPWRPQWFDCHPEHNLDWGHHKEAFVKIWKLYDQNCGRRQVQQQIVFYYIEDQIGGFCKVHHGDHNGLSSGAQFGLGTP